MSSLEASDSGCLLEKSCVTRALVLFVIELPRNALNGIVCMTLLSDAISPTFDEKTTGVLDDKNWSLLCEGNFSDGVNTGDTFLGVVLGLVLISTFK